MSQINSPIQIRINCREAEPESWSNHTWRTLYCWPFHMANKSFLLFVYLTWFTWYLQPKLMYEWIINQLVHRSLRSGWNQGLKRNIRSRVWKWSSAPWVRSSTPSGNFYVTESKDSFSGIGQQVWKLKAWLCCKILSGPVGSRDFHRKVWHLDSSSCCGNQFKDFIAGPKSKE